MAISVYFNNKKITLPGAYATVAAGEQNDPRALDYGKCLIIDTGKFGEGWCGGKGITTDNGDNTTEDNGTNAVYRFDNIDDFRSFVKGGMYWQLANALFFPDATNAAAVGVSEIMFVRAAKTKPATMTFEPAGQTDQEKETSKPGSNGGTIVITTKDEGYIANGTKGDDKFDDGGTYQKGNAASSLDDLKKGYGFRTRTGDVDPSKLIFEIYRGTFTGLYNDGISYNEVSLADSKPELVIASPEFGNISDLAEWMRNSSAFNNLFELESANPKGTGAVTNNDASGNNAITPAKEGSDDYTGTDQLNNVLKAITNLDNSFVFADDNTEAISKKILSHITQDAKFKKLLFVAGKDDQYGFSESIEEAQALNSPYACYVHGGVGMASTATGIGYRWWGSYYNMCSILARTAGKAPQIPVTNKTIGVSKLQHQLNDTDKKRALDAGLLVTIYNESLQKFVVLQGINTMQGLNNQVLFTNNGESFSIQFMRVVMQINKELVVNSEIDLLSAENGVNSNTLSAGILKNWTENYLLTRTATATSDNLLLSYRNVTVTKKDDYYLVTYGIVINNEINKIFFTGFVFKN